MSSASGSILFFGGTFDPPHYGHIRLPQLAKRKIKAKKIIYSPASMSPHKLDCPPSSAEHRVNMLELALEKVPDCEINLWEIKQGPPSYTVDAIEYLIEKNLDESFRFLIGDDQATSLHRWHEYEKLINLAPPLVMLRNYKTKKIFEKKIVEMTNDRDWASFLVDHVVELPLDKSESSAIRRSVLSKFSCDSIPAKVQTYIASNNLYTLSDM